MSESLLKNFSLFRQCKVHNWQTIMSIANHKAGKEAKCPYCEVDSLIAELEQVKAERDEYRAALERIAGDLPNILTETGEDVPCPDCVYKSNIAREALLKYKEVTTEKASSEEASS